MNATHSGASRAFGLSSTYDAGKYATNATGTTKTSARRSHCSETSIGYWDMKLPASVNALTASRPSTAQKTRQIAAAQIAEKIAAPEMIESGTSTRRAVVQSTSTDESAYTSTA